MIVAILWSLLTLGPADLQNPAGEKAFQDWPLSKAIKILNDSAWARQETFTSVVGGVGSGRAGEKEIYSRFYVRFLSAPPIREAYARVLQIEHGYDRLDSRAKMRFDELLQPLLKIDLDSWIVVAVSFRCNDPDLESQVRRYFQSETTDTLKDKAFLSTGQFSQVKVHSYFPPLEEGVGAKFVFPRVIDGVNLAAEGKGSISFELLDIPIRQSGGQEGFGGGSQRGGGGRQGGTGSGNQGGPEDNRNSLTVLRATFSVEDMLIDGKLIY